MFYKFGFLSSMANPSLACAALALCQAVLGVKDVGMDKTDKVTALTRPSASGAAPGHERDKYLPNVLLLHLVPLGHYFPLEETTVFVVVQSLLSEKVGFLFGLRVLQVLLMLGYPLLLFLLGCAMVLVHFL